MKIASVRLLFVLTPLLAGGAALHAAEPGIEFFESKIRPLLVKHCYECHSSDVKKIGGSLLLDSREGVLKGGESGPAIVPGKPEKSPLISAVRYADDSFQMPPRGKLSAAEIAHLEEWVRLGAPDPRDKPSRASSAGAWEETLAARRQWWSLRPVAQTPLPRVRDTAWPADPLDHFILARIEALGLSPSPAAGPRVLARRLSLVLLGLPPAPEDVDVFVKEYTQAPRPTLEKYVDSLLESPHFGERWARHWMDVVRFSETHGNEWNYEVHHAWRYRDYLIRALNADLAYDQLVREHIAGDLLPPRWNRAERLNEAVIGTAFYRFGEVNHDDCISLRQIGYDIADNQLDTLTKAFQAVTVACARCHDHKLDAVSMRDYYALLGILRSSRLVSHTLDAPEVNQPQLDRLQAIKVELRRELARVWQREADQMPAYMRAAEARHAERADAAALAEALDPVRLMAWVNALNVEKSPLEDSLEPWRAIVKLQTQNAAAIDEEWRKLAEKYRALAAERAEFNARFEMLADFRRPETEGWHFGGHGLRGPLSGKSDFAPATSGESLIQGVLPAGRFTHSLSDRLNGTLRSPVLDTRKKHISFEVIGERSSAVRLVSNNCQLNYKNYKALVSNDWHWVTFPLPEDPAGLRVYAELMTMFDNPKFPDQLSALGGDTANYRLPWEKAAKNPRSYFGIARVVLHDAPDAPQASVSHLLPLFGPAAENEAESPADKRPAPPDHAHRYGAVLAAAISAWQEGKASDEQSRWLDSFVKRGLLSNRPAASPELQRLAAEYRALEAELKLPKISPGLADFGAGLEQPVFVRGDCLRAGEPVPRRFVEALAGSREPIQSAGSGRLELAEAIASPTNPLTARVMVNRLWHHVFGAGLVRTVDDFGHAGELPSHPELLDHLSHRFVEEGWSLKRLIRALVLSRTFQCASLPSAAVREADPENRLLARYPSRRLEAEAIRDSILAVSGRLDRALFGPSVHPYREKENADRRLFPGPLDGAGRRSIYIKSNLMEAPKFLGVFNLPGGKVTQGRRDTTNVPAQALALLNDPFVLEQSRVFADRLLSRGEQDAAARIDAMFSLALGRRPSQSERDRFLANLNELAELHGVPREQVFSSRLVWQEQAHAIFNLQEFVYIP